MPRGSQAVGGRGRARSRSGWAAGAPGPVTAVGRREPGLGDRGGRRGARRPRGVRRRRRPAGRRADGSRDLRRLPPGSTTASGRVSMHAYAADDPVFLALNRAANGRPTARSVTSASSATRRSRSAQGSPPTAQPGRRAAWAKGVTCYFCHNAVDGHRRSQQPDPPRRRRQTMRGGLRDPIGSPAHRTAYSNLLDATKADLVASCAARATTSSPRPASTSSAPSPSGRPRSSPAPSRARSCRARPAT
jgi:hypothetical protein